MDNKTRQLHQIIEAAGGDFYVAKAGAAVYNGITYEEIFDSAPFTGTFDPERWRTIAEIHEVVIRGKPETAHEWLELTERHFLQRDSSHMTAYVLGTVVGWLRAGHHLDLQQTPPTKFQEKVLYSLDKMICGPLKLDDSTVLQSASYRNELSSAMHDFLFPKPAREDRARDLRGFVHNLDLNVVEKHLGPLDRLLLATVCELVARHQTLRQKISALHLFFTNHRPPLDGI